MKAGSLVVAFATISIVAGCANTDPTKIAFPDNTDKALVLFQAEPAGVAYTVHLMQYNPVDQSLGGSFNGAALIEVNPSSTPTYVAATLEPGTYVFQDLIQQQHWAVCFNLQTRSFTVHAGEAVFLGDFRPRLHLAQLESLAAQNGQTVGNNASVFHYFENIIPPQITTPVSNSADFLLAKRYEAASMPMLHGRLQPVVYQPAKFGTGYTLFGERVCGGYFKEKLKPAS